MQTPNVKNLLSKLAEIESEALQTDAVFLEVNYRLARLAALIEQEKKDTETRRRDIQKITGQVWGLKISLQINESGGGKFSPN
jgi:hypothetical protein